MMALYSPFLINDIFHLNISVAFFLLSKNLAAVSLCSIKKKDYNYCIYVLNAVLVYTKVLLLNCQCMVSGASYVISPISQSPVGLLRNLKIFQSEFSFLGILTAYKNNHHGHMF